MIEPDPRFQRMADRHAARERQREADEQAAEEARRVELLREAVITARRPGESEPNYWDPDHIGHRSHLCMGVGSRCQCGVMLGLACFVPPGPGEVVPACEVCRSHGLAAEPWVGQDYDDE